MPTTPEAPKSGEHTVRPPINVSENSSQEGDTLTEAQKIAKGRIASYGAYLQHDPTYLKFLEDLRRHLF